MTACDSNLPLFGLFLNIVAKSEIEVYRSFPLLCVRLSVQ